MGISGKDSRRRLNHGERQVAMQVFQQTIPYDAISVVNRLGFRGRPYTLCQSAFEDREPTYHLYVGADGFAGMETTQKWREYMVHELTHVWQACHSDWPPAYIFSSAWHILTEGDDAYKVTAGAPWKSYTAEEQASIVEKWYAAGQPKAGFLYPYIQGEILVATKLP